MRSINRLCLLLLRGRDCAREVSVVKDDGSVWRGVESGRHAAQSRACFRRRNLDRRDVADTSEDCAAATRDPGVSSAQISHREERDARDGRLQLPRLAAVYRAQDAPLIASDERVVTPALRALLHRFTMLLAPHTDKTSSQSTLTLARDGNLPLALPELTPVRARKYIPLQSGRGTRRYEVVIRPVNAQHDAAVFEHVVDWLAQKRQQYLSKPASFAIPISAAAALDGGFAHRIAASLSRHSMDDGLVMLIVPAAAWRVQPEGLQPLLELCDQHRCRVILDDFELNEPALLLLRSKAIRMLKLSAELTAAAMHERFPRALLSACTHIARVLGIHCIAKRVDNATAGRWLGVAGVDYLDPFSSAETDAATTTDEALVLQLVS